MGVLTRVRAGWSAMWGVEQPEAGVSAPITENVGEWITEAARQAVAAPPTTVNRQGFEYGIPPGGLTETRQGIGSATQSDRRTLLQELYESYLACPWSWAAVNVIARTITAGGLIMEWAGDETGGEREAPPKPANVQAMERLFAWCNPREDIRQLLRGVITDLLIFGDAFVEVVWIGSVPVSLFSLDSPSMFPIADEHGTITGYKQVTEFGQRAHFAPREVIHISLDSPRSSIFGVSPTQANLLPITAWLFAAATAKELFRKGNPVNIHVDFPVTMDQQAINRWDAIYATRNIGPRNIGVPIVTKGGATVKELKTSNVQEYLAFLDQKRDEILSGYGVPPAEAGIIETGNIGGGTGDSQHKVFVMNTCDPIAALILEKIQFHLAVQGFGIDGWNVKFGKVDLRDSKIIEEIRDMQIKNGTITVNKARTEVGEPSVDGGDNAVIVDKGGVILIRDLETISTANIAKTIKGGDLELDEPKPGQPLTLKKAEKLPLPPGLAGAAGLPPTHPNSPDNPANAGKPQLAGKTSVADGLKGASDAKIQNAEGKVQQQQSNAKATSAKKSKKAKTSKKSKVIESVIENDWRRVSGQWAAEYSARKRRALDELPVLEHDRHDGDEHSDHDHHNGPDYKAADLGVKDLKTVTVDPRDVKVDHEHYQRKQIPEHVDTLAAEGKAKLEKRRGLLARRPDGSLWVVDGQHHTAAAVKEGVAKLTYMVFDSTGPQMEKRVFDAWQHWDKSDNPKLRGNAQYAGAK